MLIAKSPLRVSLFGGGTDYPSYTAKNKSTIVGGTIDKFIYITANKLSEIANENIRLCYRKVEACNELNDLSHPIVREYLKLVKFKEKFGFYTIADIPGGSGLGSSSSFSVGFIKLIDFINNNERSLASCAQQAIRLEQDILGEPVGIQDQYHASFGGFGKYEFTSNSYSYSEFSWSPEDYQFMNDRVCLVHTGGFRDAKDILVDQHKNSQTIQQDGYLDRMVELAENAAHLLHDKLDDDKIAAVSSLLNESWSLKMSLSSKISNQNVRELIDKGLSGGALGAKLLGAGGEGFVFFIGKDDCYEKMKGIFGEARTIKFQFGSYRANVQKFY